MTPLPRHPALRPGVRVSRRGDGMLQVGLAPHLAVRTPDVAEVRAFLAGLAHSSAVPPWSDLSPALQRLTRDLLERGLLIDSTPLFRALGTAPTPAMREAIAAEFSGRGAAAADERTARAALRVAVLDDGLPTWARHAADLLTTAGFAVSPASVEPEVVLHLARGVTPRSLSDTWMRQDQPHLVISCAEGIVQLGPFVVPGTSACLRCLDAHLGDRDPHRGLIIEQYTAADRATASDLGVFAEPVPSDLLSIAVAMAVRDLTTWSTGASPSTLNQSVEVDPALQFPATRWSAHVGCGCTWDRLVAG